MKKHRPYQRRPKKALDGRTRWARRKRDIAALYAKELGRELPTLSVHEAVTINNAAAISTKLEQLQIQIQRNEAGPDVGNELVRLNNTLRRLLRGLGWDKTRTVRGGKLVRKSAPPPGHVLMRDRIGARGNGVVP